MVVELYRFLEYRYYSGVIAGFFKIQFKICQKKSNFHHEVGKSVFLKKHTVKVIHIIIDDSTPCIDFII